LPARAYSWNSRSFPRIRAVFLEFAQASLKKARQEGKISVQVKSCLQKKIALSAQFVQLNVTNSESCAILIELFSDIIYFEIKASPKFVKQHI